MNRSWTDFKSLHGNIAGAREAFEDACETLFKKKHEGQHVSQVKVKQGDGGIDIFIGEFGIEPITVIQCKFFLESFDKSQQGQIRESFKKAIGSDKYELKNWVLCLPRVIDIDENGWWFEWKHKQLKEHGKNEGFISLVNGNELIDLFKEYDLYNRIFKIEDSIKIDEIHAHLVPKKVNLPKDSNPNLILFNNYTKLNEPYYIQRDSDANFKEALEISNIWVFGKSGFGKTALVNRNLINQQIQYCFCDLSPITIVSKEDVLNEILCTLEEQLSTERDLKEPNILKQISKILCDNGAAKTVIVIDELSVAEDHVLRNIADNFIKLVTHYSNKKPQNDLKFVVSTIADPKNIIENKSKAIDHFQYICCDSWENYSSQLFDTISEALNIDLSKMKSAIIEESKYSPRVIKSIFKKVIVYGDQSTESVEKAIKTTLDEIVE